MFKALFDKIKAPFNRRQVVISTEPKTIWRNNMWVITPAGLGIIFRLGEPSEVHIVDEGGLTTDVRQFSTEVLRQAYYSEIPENRRGSVEKATRLGYK